MTRWTLDELLDLSCRDHSHLCPRQILGVRMGLAGLEALGLDRPPEDKRLLVITETDGCFVDGLSAATGCAVGHRTLRVEDYGKAAATFVDTRAGSALRLAPALDLRQRSWAYAPGEPRRYFAQMHAYKVMPAAEMFSFMAVCLKSSIEQLVSRPKVRTICARCGEEIINEREIPRDGQNFCRGCAGEAYYKMFPPGSIAGPGPAQAPGNPPA